MKSLRTLAGVVAAALALAANGCHRGEPTPPAAAATSVREPQAADARPPRRENGPLRDLSVDESMGGHTLTRHIGKTNEELLERLRREPQISAASTYTDRAAAERAVGSAVAAGGGRLAQWQHRTGRRPNLVLHYVDRTGQAVGRSLSRGQQTAVSCDRIIVVLRWDERSDRFYVLTSYPEAER